MGRSPIDPVLRLVAQTDSDPARYCRDLWTGAIRKDFGYGVLSMRSGFGRKYVIGAHRFALVLATGYEPPDLWALHTCDNPPCVTPEHLYWGTPQNNVDDMDGRGRRVASAGERNRHAKLTLVQVEAIRASTDSAQELATRYGVTPKTIRRVRTGRTWR